MGSIEVVVGGQFGSEGKGAIAAWRSKPQQENETVLGIRVAGPNAGHTVIGDKGVDTSATVAPNLCEPMLPLHNDADAAVSVDGRYAWRLRQVPVAAVTNPNAVLLLAAGSEIDWPVLLNEIDMLDAAGYQASERLLIDEQVTLISDRHKYEETHGRLAGATGIATLLGSTGKGIGAARADRIWREPSVCLAQREDMLVVMAERGVSVTDGALVANGIARSLTGRVIIEGTQGYGLGLHAGYYPYCTSSDCRAIDFLAMAGISPWQSARIDDLRTATVIDGRFTVWVCLRPYPIRVGGNSGPMRDETTWEELGLPQEHTTVTGKIRRVGRWDGELARAAVFANGGPGGAVKIAVTMLDTLVPEIAGWTVLPERAAAEVDDPTSTDWQSMLKASSRLREEVEWLSRECLQPIAAVGTGPDTVLELDTDRG